MRPRPTRAGGAAARTKKCGGNRVVSGVRRSSPRAAPENPGRGAALPALTCARPRGPAEGTGRSWAQPRCRRCSGGVMGFVVSQRSRAASWHGSCTRGSARTINLVRTRGARAMSVAPAQAARGWWAHPRRWPRSRVGVLMGVYLLQHGRRPCRGAERAAAPQDAASPERVAVHRRRRAARACQARGKSAPRAMPRRAV
jgi:hypothetical protein